VSDPIHREAVRDGRLRTRHGRSADAIPADSLKVATLPDISLIKRTQIRENIYAELGMEWFNAFNTPVFYSNPDLVPTDPAFGAVIRDNGQSNSPRQIQIRCRLVF
jgi:hypothetical protein